MANWISVVFMNGVSPQSAQHAHSSAPFHHFRRMHLPEFCVVLTHWNAISASNYGSNLIICTHTVTHTRIHQNRNQMFFFHPFGTIFSTYRSAPVLWIVHLCAIWRGPHANAWNSIQITKWYLSQFLTDKSMCVVQMLRCKCDDDQRALKLWICTERNDLWGGIVKWFT